MPDSKKPLEIESSTKRAPSLLGQTSITIDVAKCLLGIAAIIAALKSPDTLAAAIKALM